MTSPRSTTRDLEIGLVGNRDRIAKHGLVVVFGANALRKVLVLNAPVAPHGSPGLIEDVRIIHRENHFHPLAAVDHSPALDDVQLFGVRRAVDVGGGLGVQPDRIDDEAVAFVMADRFAIHEGFGLAE